jgi:hypothetical protein
MPEDFNRDSVKTDGKVDPIRAGLTYADYVVTGNDMRDEIAVNYSDLNVTCEKIQGSPSDISTKFAEFYKRIAADS